MDDVALANYMAGFYTGNVEAGRLDRLCADLLGIPVGTIIWFSDYTFLKLKQRHGEINFAHYHHLPSILLKGFVARGRHSNLVEMWWIDETLEKTAFFAVLKATRNSEVFVGTFHRIDLKEARRLFKRANTEGRLIREQQDAKRLLQPGKDHLQAKRKRKA